MSTIDDGGTAFPLLSAIGAGPDHMQTVGIVCGQKGMSLRDYFAAKVLQGMYAQGGDESVYTPKTIDADYVRHDFTHGQYGSRKTEAGYWSVVRFKEGGQANPTHKQVTTYEQRITREAYLVADAMLEARKAGGS